MLRRAAAAALRLSVDAPLMPRHPTLFSTVAPCGSRRRAPPCCCFRASQTRTRAPCCSNARLVHPCPRHAHPALRMRSLRPTHTRLLSPLVSSGCSTCSRATTSQADTGPRRLQPEPLLRLEASPPARGLSSGSRPLLRPARRDAVHTSCSVATCWCADAAVYAHIELAMRLVIV